MSASDVYTACRVLNVKTKREAREWWRSAARRNGLRVVDTEGKNPLRRGRKGMLSVVGNKSGRKLRFSEVEKRLEVKQDDFTNDEESDIEGGNQTDDLSNMDEEESSDEQFFSMASDVDANVPETDAQSVIWSSSSSARSVSPEGERVVSDHQDQPGDTSPAGPHLSLIHI